MFVYSFYGSIRNGFSNCIEQFFKSTWLSQVGEGSVFNYFLRRLLRLMAG